MKIRAWDYLTGWRSCAARSLLTDVALLTLLFRDVHIVKYFCVVLKISIYIMYDTGYNISPNVTLQTSEVLAYILENRLYVVYIIT